MSALTVHLNRRAVGTLAEDERSGDYSFAYRAEAEEAFGEYPLSISLPYRADPFGPSEARPFFEGLLPEGDTRERIARELRLSSDNSFGLLAELGRDCAGAAVILPADEPPPSSGAVDWLSDDELTDLITRLPSAPLGVTAGTRIRLSLAGLQRKAVLVRDEDGRFGVPTAATPSTHIVKPQYADAPQDDLVFNEHYCLRTAAAAGLVCAQSEIVRLGGRSCLVVERFDRDRTEAGTTRIHQEDLCQALGSQPGLKYQAEGGPGLADIADLLRRVSTRSGADVLALVHATIVNYVLGNSDAHAKNFALLHDKEHLRLAPLYDIVSTTVYPEFDGSFAMSIGENADPKTIDDGDILDFAEDCGLSYTELSREWVRVAATALRAAEHVADAARAEGWHRPVIDRILAVARKRAQQIA